MTKIILISAIAATGLFADMMTDMATDAMKAQAKTEARSTAVKHLAGDDAMKKEVVNAGVDKVLGKENPVDKMKSDALGSVMGSSTSIPDTSSLLGGATKESSLKDKGIDMAADQAEKTVGKETLKKETAKTVIKSVI